MHTFQSCLPGSGRALLCPLWLCGHCSAAVRGTQLLQARRGDLGAECWGFLFGMSGRFSLFMGLQLGPLSSFHLFALNFPCHRLWCRSDCGQGDWHVVLSIVCYFSLGVMWRRSLQVPPCKCSSCLQAATVCLLAAHRGLPVPSASHMSEPCSRVCLTFW